MKHSVLNREDAPRGAVGRDTVEDLLLNRAHGEFCRDTNAQRIFTDVIAAPLTDAEDIVMRQSVCTDFAVYPQLLPQLAESLAKLREIKNSLQSERTSLLSVRRSSEPRNDYVTVRGVADIEAGALTSVFDELESFARSFAICPPRSELLIKLKRRLDELTTGDAVGELRALALALLGSLSEVSRLHLRLDMNGDGKIAGCGLLFSETPVAKAQKTGILERFIRTKEREIPSGVKIDDHFDVLDFSVMKNAVTELCDMISDLLRGIFDEFLPLEGELAFWKIALDYIAFMRGRSMTLIYPELAAVNGVSFDSLSDILLAVTRPTGSLIVPNDFKFDADTPGVLIRGENNSGKTVYVRSVGLAVLFAQAGLPIPAKAARICPVSGIFTLWAAEEKEFEGGNTAGRFEQEVRELSALLDTVPHGALVILNETFQSTAYDEGADGLHPILQYLSRIGVGWLLVSHLTKLDSLCGENVVRMTTGEGYRLMNKKKSRHLP